MANAVKWGQGLAATVQTVLSTELNSLANGAYTNAGTAFDNANASNLNTYGWLELNVTFGSAPTDKSTIDIYMLKAMDGTNYEDGSSSVRPAGASLVASIDLRNSTSAQKRASGMFVMPPSPVKFLAYNGSGQAFPASGSTVKLFMAYDEVK